MNILDKIVANTKKEVAERKSLVTAVELEYSPFFSRNCYKVTDFLVDPEKSGIIAEIKKQSPSKGIINDTISVEEVGVGYEKSGASAISVLTDFEFFGWRMDYLTEVREKVNIPVLRKDFMVDEYQVIEAKAIGADFILLIAACLTPEEMKKMATLAHSLGMQVLMEVHNKEELLRSIMPELDVIGVNNRNLKTFDVSIQTSLDLLEFIPDEFKKVSESGLSEVSDMKELKSAGFDGVLIGETFMKTEDPGEALAKLVKELKS
jgi:indole-3-glycerol phosphate synthase